MRRIKLVGGVGMIQHLGEVLSGAGEHVKEDDDSESELTLIVSDPREPEGAVEVIGLEVDYYDRETGTTYRVTIQPVPGG